MRLSTTVRVVHSGFARRRIGPGTDKLAPGSPPGTGWGLRPRRVCAGAGLGSGGVRGWAVALAGVGAGRQWGQLAAGRGGGGVREWGVALAGSGADRRRGSGGQVAAGSVGSGIGGVSGT
ncbi:hypothetical protein GCM10010483_31030 [Actinokineospora diospyrosa]